MPRHHHVPLRRFERMSLLKDYTVEKGLADPRGWRVVDASGHVIGEVTDLIVDTDRMAASYLEVQLDRKMFAVRDDPHILVPMARAERDGGERRVVAGDLTRSRINALFEARARHDAVFWEQWWRDTADLKDDDAGKGTSRTSVRSVTAAERAESSHAVPGAVASDETAGAAVDSDYPVEQRTAHGEERLTARGEVEDSRIGRPAERVYRPPLGRSDEPPPAPRYRSRTDDEVKGHG